MQENGWKLYGEPVEKKGIVKALRGWAKYHPEYEPEENKGLLIMKKARKYMPAKLTNEIIQNGENWLKYIPQYCPKNIFTDEELTILWEKLGVRFPD